MLDNFVFTKHFFVEVGNAAQTIPLKKAFVIRRFETLQIDTDILKQIEYDFICVFWVDDSLRAAVAYARVAINRMFIALGVTPEIIMVVQDQDFLIRSMLLLIKIGSRQSANAGTNNNQVVVFLQFGGWTPIRTPTPCAAMCVIV